MKERNSYNVGIYCRLSRDDGDSGTSSSIKTQKDMLSKYVQDNGWAVFDFYVDDGYTGTNFNRPDFQRMIADIEAGKINMVIVKDLSRLGRDYILTGQHTDIYFPARGVRFVALNDGVDSINEDNDIAPFRNILNQMYAADISKKIRSAVRAKQLKGEMTASFVPIGYQRDPANINRLIIEESGAAVVRRIFEMARADKGGRAIRGILNDEGIPTPRQHYRWVRHGIQPQPALWGDRTVIDILRNRVYLGDMVQGIYDCPRFKRTPPKRRPKEEWIITPGTHEPLVDKETWEFVQRRIAARHRPKKNNVMQPFAGFLKCEDCGRAVTYSKSRWGENYSCGAYRQHGRRLCTSHYIRKDVLEQVVLDDIRKYAKLAKHEGDKLTQQVRKQRGEKDANQIKALTSELKKLSDRKVELERILKRLYEDRVNGDVPDDLFCQFLAEYRQEQSDVQIKIADAEQKISEIKASQRDTDSWVKLIQNYTRIKKLDRTILCELVDKITVGEAQVVDGNRLTDVTIYYRFVGAVN